MKNLELFHGFKLLRDASDMLSTAALAIGVLWILVSYIKLRYASKEMEQAGLYLQAIGKAAVVIGAFVSFLMIAKYAEIQMEYYQILING